MDGRSDQRSRSTLRQLTIMGYGPNTGAIKMNQPQKEKADAMLEFFTADLMAQGMTEQAAFVRALEAVNRLIKNTK